MRWLNSITSTLVTPWGVFLLFAWYPSAILAYWSLGVSSFVQPLAKGSSLLYLRHYLLLLYSVSLSPTEGYCSCSVVENTLVLGFRTGLGLSIDEN
jgi:hypothetical protein